MPALPRSVGQVIYNKRQTGAENGGKEPLASNQAVGGSNPSGYAMFSMTYNVSEKISSPIETRFSYWILTFKVVIDDCESPSEAINTITTTRMINDRPG